MWRQQVFGARLEGAIESFGSEVIVRLIQHVDRDDDPDALARHLSLVTFRAMSADACTIHVRTAAPHGDHLQLLGQYGLTTQEKTVCEVVEMSLPSPFTLVTTRANPAVLTAREIQTQFPIHTPVVAGTQALVCLSLSFLRAHIGIAAIRVHTIPRMTETLWWFLNGVTSILNLYVRSSPQSVLPPDLRPHRQPIGLTARQRTILGLVQLGHTNDSIAQQLRFSTSLIKLDLSRAMVALGVHDRYQAVTRARQLGLLHET